MTSGMLGGSDSGMLGGSDSGMLGGSDSGMLGGSNIRDGRGYLYELVVLKPARIKLPILDSPGSRPQTTMDQASAVYAISIVAK